MKQILLSVLCFLLFIAVSKAGEQQQSFKANTSALSDTTLKKDSLSQTINDLKQGFKDLFVTNTLGNGINVEQLNPQAISFVQDYIDRFGKTMEDMKSWGRPYFDMMDAILYPMRFLVSYGNQAMVPYEPKPETPQGGTMEHVERMQAMLSTREE